MFFVLADERKSQDTRKQIELIKKQQAAESPDDTKKENDGIRTIFHEILQSNLPPSEKTTERLGREAQAITGAGLETISWSAHPPLRQFSTRFAPYHPTLTR